MARELEPIAVLFGTTLFSYCLWQLVFDPLRGPIPGGVLPVVALGIGVATGLGLMAWGLRRLGVLSPP
ncbi:hypothetical protein M0R89_06985 [Halorussus limi]|uniref:Uncharacterized protein n=1 Tax=Halorussus limi TaxID=2938695 RepID=A0A8U0HY08_9EURY|nr:hypothetical protein [Halorussus limi]UPV75797.1 hypothetical protein M0R89_06985 [Halorussus limi]